MGEKGAVKLMVRAALKLLSQVIAAGSSAKEMIGR